MSGKNDTEAARGQNELASNRNSWSTNQEQKAGGHEMGRVRHGIFYNGGLKEEPRRIRHGIFYDGLKKETVINIEF